MIQSCIGNLTDFSMSLYDFLCARLDYKSPGHPIEDTVIRPLLRIEGKCCNKRNLVFIELFFGFFIGLPLVPVLLSTLALYKEHNAGARGIKMITSSRRAG